MLNPTGTEIITRLDSLLDEYHNNNSFLLGALIGAIEADSIVLGIKTPDQLDKRRRSNGEIRK